MEAGAAAADGGDFDRFVPRLALEWHDRHGDTSWRQLPGTLVFVDISGFTNLSEKLAQRGRVGAEELTEVLDRVFGAMLELSYERGGGLLKFGGDALLLLFEGADRVVQACCAAVEMRSALRAAASIPTSVGRVPLRMSVGVHDGPVDFFRVGRSHRELVVTGPVATTTTVMESAAAAGEILVSADVARALPPGAVGAERGPGSLLRWRSPKAVAPGPVRRRPVDETVRDSCIPVGLRRVLLSGGSDSSHRVATIGFVKYSGVDDLLARAGPEVVAARLDDLVSTVQAAADREGVTFLATDIDANGGKVILASGVPSAQEDDEGRMLRTLQTIVTAPSAFVVRAGAHRGHVFAGEIGTPFRATYTVIGDTVNLAARLMAAAATGSCYATPAVVERSRSLFDVSALEPFKVKGKAEPVHALAVGAEIGTRDSAAHELPFVGREFELAQLRELLASALKGAGEAAIVTGDVGIGKTRLVHETLVSLGAVDVLAIRGEPYGAAMPYRALRDAVRGLLQIERGDNATMARQLKARVGEIAPHLAAHVPLLAEVAHIDAGTTPDVDAIDPRFRRDRLGDVVVALLDRLLFPPAVIAIEDAHWLDDSSAHLVARIASEAASRPWAVVVTCPAAHARSFSDLDARELHLEPLEADAVRRIVLDMTRATPLHPTAVAEMVQRANGSPLFVEEMLRAVGDTGSVTALPDSLEAVVGAQIDALPPLAGRILRCAAVLGRSFSLPVVAALEGHAFALDAATLELLGPFLERDGAERMRFRHPVVRDVAYESLPFRRRQSLHRRAGEVTENLARDDPTAVAHLLSLHFSLAQEHAKAWEYARIAGDRALDAYANVEAATHFQRAFDAARRLGVDEAQRAEILTKLGDARERAGMFGASLDAYRRASRLVRDDPERGAALMLKRARARERSGAFPVALRELTAGLSLLAGRSSDEAVRCRARLAAFGAMVRWGQEQSRAALRTAEAAIADARRVSEQAALAQALMVADLAEVALHGAATGSRLREALAIFESLGDLPSEGQARGNLGFVAAHAGRWDEAVEWFTSSRAVFARSGDAVGSALADLNLGEVLVKQRRTDEAAAVLEDAAQVLRSVGFADGAAYAELLLAQAWCDFGRYDDVEAVCARVGVEFTELGQRASALEAALVHADCEVRRGRPHDALELVARAERTAGAEREQFAPRAALVRAAARAALGQLDACDEAIEVGLAAARSRGAPYEEALLLALDDDLRAAAGRPRDAAARRSADAVLAGLGVRR